MEYKLNLGSWNSVFAVPSDIVDKHLKLAGAVQLKVLLWVLRHAGDGFTVEDIASALMMQPADVRDSMLYWTETGVICIDSGMISPSEPTVTVTEKKEEAEKEEPVTSEKAEEKEPEKKRSGNVLSKPVKPDFKYLTKRMAENENIAFLMKTADEIFGRITSDNEKAVLLMILESFGLPEEVIIMLLRYTAEIGKCNIRYIEKTAMNWADDEINTVMLADQRIKQLTEGKNAAYRIQNILGTEKHSPTDKEIRSAQRWIQEWKFSDEMIRRAYEICIDSKTKYIPGYVDSILERWNNSGISTIEQVEAEKIKASKKKKNTEGYEATYDISAYESTSVIDEEED